MDPCGLRRRSNDLSRRYQCSVGDDETKTGRRDRLLDASATLELLFTAAICQAEILAGIAVLPTGRRRGELEAMAQAIFGQDLKGRILPFDVPAATAYAELFAVRRQAGRPIETPDLIIAATARAHGAAIVTRDVGGFEGCGLTLVNPWQPG